ncbi:hypothetical protein H4R18_000205 [Coemansia javaensis]|uniref:Cell division cycle protein 123 n=1 Tax=Coemansia javaensis TaxID=2761396 RepID=A0A9W8HIV3_9FUNG|nr:hypothetical protein H4R18_000205 [Coemansia javaensis]
MSGAPEGHADTGAEQNHSDDERLLFEPLSHEEILNCAFSSWYPRFRRVTIKSEIIKPLERDFVDYLLADGVVLPEHEDRQYRGEIEVVGGSGSEWSEWSDDGEDGDGDGDGDAEASDVRRLAQSPGVKRTCAEIRRRIEALGGEVFLRMGWSAPADASWITSTGTLKCRGVPDICSLLKGSNAIARDLAAGRYGVQPSGAEPELVLRRWANLTPSMLFRCFVRFTRLVAISQVDYQHYAFLAGMADEITAKLTRFFADHVAAQFPSQSYCFDAYIAAAGRDQVFVVDFEPWAHSVDTYLFSWRELAADAAEFLGLRLFPEYASGLAYYSSRYAASRCPAEVTDDALRGSVAAAIERMKSEHQGAQ